jgi:membrane-associated phospholipid phosphatase
MVAPVSGKIVTASGALWRSSPLTRVFVQCFLLTAVMIGLGFFVTNFLVYLWPLSIEDDAVRAIVAARTPMLDRISNDVSLVAYTSGLAVVTIVAGCAMRIAFHTWRELFFLTAAILAEVQVFMITALTVARARPPVLELDNFPPMESFPSGHVAAAVALYGGIAMILATRARRTWHAIACWALLLIVPVAVAISRVYRGMHHPSDVAASFIIGFGCLFILQRAMLVPALPAAMRAS